MIDLKYLKISVPSYEDEETMYHWRSIESILRLKDPHEMKCLRSWLEDNLLEVMIFALEKEDFPALLTEEYITNILGVFHLMGAKLINCIYEESDDDIDECSQDTEPGISQDSE